MKWIRNQTRKSRRYINKYGFLAWLFYKLNKFYKNYDENYVKEKYNA